MNQNQGISQAWYGKWWIIVESARSEERSRPRNANRNLRERPDNNRIGNFFLTNRLTSINNQIEYDWLNKILNIYKLICKLLFLT